MNEVMAMLLLIIIIFIDYYYNKDSMNDYYFFCLSQLIITIDYWLWSWWIYWFLMNDQWLIILIDIDEWFVDHILKSFSGWIGGHLRCQAAETSGVQWGDCWSPTQRWSWWLNMGHLWTIAVTDQICLMHLNTIIVNHELVVTLVDIGGYNRCYIGSYKVHGGELLPSTQPLSSVTSSVNLQVG